MTVFLGNCFLSYLLHISISSKLLGQFGNIITPYHDTFILTQMVIASALLSTIFHNSTKCEKVVFSSILFTQHNEHRHQALVGLFTYHVMEEKVYFW